MDWTLGRSDCGALPRTASKYNNAGVQVDLGGNGLASPFRGGVHLTDEQADQLLAGQWYVNIHTAAHPDGEIRGQVLRQP